MTNESTNGGTERRATFQSTSISENGSSVTRWAASIKRRTAVLGLLAACLTVALGFFSLKNAIVTEIRGVALQEFKQQLDVFHTQAKPKILKAVDDKIQVHKLSGPHPGGLSEVEVKDLVSELKGEVRSVQRDVEHLSTQSAHQTELLEELLRKSGSN